MRASRMTREVSHSNAQTLPECRFPQLVIDQRSFLRGRRNWQVREERFGSSLGSSIALVRGNFPRRRFPRLIAQARRPYGLASVVQNKLPAAKATAVAPDSLRFVQRRYLRAREDGDRKSVV